MPNDTKFRTLGELVGRCTFEEGEAPSNKFGSGPDMQQPEGTRFVAFGEDVLSAVTNRGLAAVAANTDYLNQVSLWRTSAPYVLNIPVGEFVYDGATELNLNLMLLRHTNSLWKVGGSVATACDGPTLTDDNVDFAANGVRAGDRLLFDPLGATEQVVIVLSVTEHTLAFLAPIATPDLKGYTVMTPPWVWIGSGPEAQTYGMSVLDSAGQVILPDTAGDPITVTDFDRKTGARPADDPVVMSAVIATDSVGRFYVTKESGVTLETYNIQAGCLADVSNFQPAPWDAALNGGYLVLGVDVDTLHLGSRLTQNTWDPQTIRDQLSAPSPLVDYPAEDAPAPGGPRGTITVAGDYFFPVASGIDDSNDLMLVLSGTMPAAVTAPGLTDGMNVTFSLMAVGVSQAEGLPRRDMLAITQDTSDLAKTTLQAAYDGEYGFNTTRATGRTIDTGIKGPVEITGAPAQAPTNESVFPTLLLVNNDYGYGASLTLVDGANGISSDTRNASTYRFMKEVVYPVSGDLITVADTDDMFVRCHTSVGHTTDADGQRPQTVVSVVDGLGNPMGLYGVHTKTAAGAASTLAILGIDDGLAPTFPPATYTIAMYEPIVEVGPGVTDVLLSLTEPSDDRWRSQSNAMLGVYHDKSRWDGVGDDDAADVASARVRASGKFGPITGYNNPEGLEMRPQLFLLRQNYAKSRLDPTAAFARFSIINNPLYHSTWDDENPGANNTDHPEDGVVEIGTRYMRVNTEDGVIFDFGSTAGGVATHGSVKLRNGYLQASGGVSVPADTLLTMSDTVLFGGLPALYHVIALEQSGKVLCGANHAGGPSEFYCVIKSSLISPFAHRTYPQITLCTSSWNTMQLVHVQTGGVDILAPIQGFPADFSLLQLAGADASNTDDGLLYYEITGANPNLVVNVYKGYTTVSPGVYAGVDLVASSPATASGAGLTLNAENASGLTGSAIGLAAAVARPMHYNNTLSYNFVKLEVYNPAAVDIDEWYFSYFFPTLRLTSMPSV